MTKRALTGNHAVAEAAKLARVKVVAAYPITPQTTIVERLAEMIEKGELEAKMIRVESEHSAMAATLGRPPLERGRSRRPQAMGSSICTRSSGGLPELGYQWLWLWSPGP